MKASTFQRAVQNFNLMISYQLWKGTRLLSLLSMDRAVIIFFSMIWIVLQGAPFKSGTTKLYFFT